MGYLEDFKNQINNRDFSKFMKIWEEYCSIDEVDIDELVELLKMIKNSDYAKLFGKYAETGLVLWERITNPEDAYLILKHLIDLQTTNTPLLADIAIQSIQKKYSNDSHYNERIRLVGLRNKTQFQGALSNYDLLAHMEVGNFVYHNAGWHTGQIMEVSAVREQLALEFEVLKGRKHLTFENAFKTLIPLPNEHFNARRFANPDKLEAEAKNDPVEVIKILLRDLGPKTAAEIKDELCDLVIHEEDWAKWWQWARSKLKKDTIIATPSSLKEPFRLRQKEVSHSDELQKTIKEKFDFNEFILKSYSMVRDMPNLLKDDKVKTSLYDKILELASDTNLSGDERFLLAIFIENTFGAIHKELNLEKLILTMTDVENKINNIEILAFKKRALTAVRDYRNDWVDLFLALLNSIQQSALRDYILKELNNSDQRQKLIDQLNELRKEPSNNPELFVWYFQKILTGDPKLPFTDKESQSHFLEAFLVLYNQIELLSGYRELIKKMYNILSGNRFATVRKIIEGTSLEFIKEFLLLVSKCRTLSDHDIKTLNSLAEVVHPTLVSKQKRNSQRLTDGHIIWTSEEGYFKTQDKIKHIGTVEIVENAREIEAARALGDLRENSEYKFALERRSRLQAELKALSDLLNRARIITKDDISSTEVGIGSVVVVENTRKECVTYMILGPWDADAEQNILSFQSKLAQAMLGCKVDDIFSFRDEEWRVIEVKSFLDASKVV